MLKIVPYQPSWPDEFLVIGRTLHQALGDLALRIDHIGSTSVPDLAAKDILDIQVTVASLDPAVKQAFDRAASRCGSDQGVEREPKQILRRSYINMINLEKSCYPRFGAL